MYVDALDALVGAEDRDFRVITRPEEDPQIGVISYPEVPAPGHQTAFTFGLSTKRHPDWLYSRPELVISVNSLDAAWVVEVGFVAKMFRGQSDFGYGSTFRLYDPISDESGMSAFFIYAPLTIEPDCTAIELPDYVIILSQLYPIYHEEVDLIRRVGADKFFEDERIDLLDIHRPNFGTLRGDSSK